MTRLCRSRNGRRTDLPSSPIEDNYERIISHSMSTDSESNDDEGNEVVYVIEGKNEIPAGTNIGIQNSRDVHFGNKTYVHSGRVVIKQIVKDNRRQDNEDKTTAASGT